MSNPRVEGRATEWTNGRWMGQIFVDGYPVAKSYHATEKQAQTWCEIEIAWRKKEVAWRSQKLEQSK